MSSATYKKRKGTAGIQGQLYETKLLSLIFYRAKHDDSIEQFQLATNVYEAGAFDDICIKAKVNGFSKPLIAFIQSKYKENSDESPEVDLDKYLLSYLKIREKFKSQDDPGSMFHGEFQECHFVIYTNGKGPFNDNAKSPSSSSSSKAKLNELIATGGIAKHPYKHKEDVIDSLCVKFAKHKTISLAKQIATFMGNEMSFQELLFEENNIILLYHVFLAQKVFDVSEIKPEGHRVATFRQDIFDTRDEYLTLFKHTLFQEILKRRTVEPDEINNLLSDVIAKPTNITKLSKLIGTVVTYNNGQLELAEKYSKYCNQQLHHVEIFRKTVDKAVELAVRDIATKVPAAFGNKDLTLRGNDKKKERRIKYLKSKIIDILNKSKPSNVIVVDKSLIDESLIEEGFLDFNGGIAGAIGNIFVPDHNTKFMKITNSCESLGTLAKSLYTKLANEIHNLHEYTFDFKYKNIPRFSLGPSDYEKSLAKDFLNNLLFYSKQADENVVEEIIKSKIEDYQRDHANYFQAKTDAMFLKYHDRIQKWWMLPKQASYLTKDSDIFEEAINSIMKDPLMSSINLTYMSKIQQFEYTFREDAASSWHLQDHSTTVIITENCVMTVVKVLQHLKKKNQEHAVLDLDYIANLPTPDRKVLCAELTKTTSRKALVFVCDELQNKRNEIKTLETTGKAVLNKTTIIITSHKSHETLQKYFPKAVSIVQDENNSLIDMSEVSQKSILETRVVFQGVEVRLDSILDDESKAYVQGNVLNTIISKETITISKLTVDRQYDEIKHLYVDRTVKKIFTRYSDIPYEKPLRFKTLVDKGDDVVIVTAEPGMGKSTLLTHLSLKTKTEYPNVWIVRVNLLEYSRELSKWKQADAAIDTLETIKFMCQVILDEKLGKENNVKFELEEDNGIVYLTQCTGDQWTEFELRLFLHFYNKDRMIFIFDGFDEICPHYTKEVILCINTVNSHNNKHKIWVTSRSYTEITKNLHDAFGELYEIEHLSDPAKKEYLMKTWQSNLILKELNKLQLKNVYDFLQFLIKPLESPLQEIYLDAANYIITEIETTSIPLWKFNVQNHVRMGIKIKRKMFKYSVYHNESERNPLNLFLWAFFFINSIKDVKHSTNKWDRDMTMFTFYEQYLEWKLKIRLQGKSKIDISKPDIMITYEKELADCIGKHKKLAAYAIFNEHINKLFNKKDLEEIEETIKFIEKGGEKTGLINIVAGIPVFVHMTFAEYFAVEYICDLLKHKCESDNKLQLMHIIFKGMFSAYYNFKIIRTIFDNKMKIDEKLMSIIRNHDEVIFNLLFKPGFEFIEKLDCCDVLCANYRIEQEYVVVTAVIEHLHGFTSLFMAIFEKYINENNFNNFLMFVYGTGLLYVAVRTECDALAICIINIVKKIDVSRLLSVLPQAQNLNFLSRLGNYFIKSSEEILQHIREYCGDNPREHGAVTIGFQTY